MSNIIVAYFSASGVTKELAERLAAKAGADLFEIRPAVPYTDADLDWMDENSRSSVEMKDRNCRPEIASVVDNMEEYDVVFVGFPVWWYREPSIIDTFMEMYDLTGKKIIPFCTSGSSGIGDSGANMQELAPGAEVLKGDRFVPAVTDDELKAWVEGMI